MNDNLPMSDPEYQRLERERVANSGLGDTPLPNPRFDTRQPLPLHEQLKERREYEATGAGDTLDKP